MLPNILSGAQSEERNAQDGSCEEAVRLQTPAERLPLFHSELCSGLCKAVLPVWHSWQPEEGLAKAHLIVRAPRRRLARVLPMAERAGPAGEPPLPPPDHRLHAAVAPVLRGARAANAEPPRTTACTSGMSTACVAVVSEYRSGAMLDS